MTAAADARALVPGWRAPLAATDCLALLAHEHPVTTTTGRGGVAGLLLTGGRSSRMGRDKATLSHPDGCSWAVRAGRLLAASTCPTLEVGPGRAGLLAVHDDTHGGGPLLAVVAGWRRLRSLGSESPTLVLACDLPLLAGRVLARLAAWPGEGSVVPVIAGRPQWCCARYEPGCLRRAAELAASGRRDLRALGEAATREGTVTWIGEEQLGEDLRLLADADTPEELAALGWGLDGGDSLPEPQPAVAAPASARAGHPAAAGLGDAGPGGRPARWRAGAPLPRTHR